MTRRAADRLAQTAARAPWLVWSLLLLLAPLLLTTGGAPDVAAALLVCALALVAATGLGATLGPVRRVGTRRSPAGSAPATPSSRIPDPVRHPLRPRAPGLV